jgi:hypothetical protein
MDNPSVGRHLFSPSAAAVQLQAPKGGFGVINLWQLVPYNTGFFNFIFNLSRLILLKTNKQTNKQTNKKHSAVSLQR